MLGDLISPIPESFVKDDKFFEKGEKDVIKIIPAYGQSEFEHHEWLKMQSCLGELSPSINALKTSFNSYVFGAGLDIANISIPGYNPSNASPDGDVAGKEDFLNELKDWGLTPVKILRTLRCMHSSSIENLNQWLRVVIVIVDGVVRVDLTPINYRNVAYLEKAKKDFADPVAIVSNWNRSDWGQKVSKPIVRAATKYGFDEVVFWDEKTSSKITTYEAVIHAPSDLCRSKRYDKSLLDGLMDTVMAEIKYCLLTGKIANTEIISKNILLMEGIAAEQGSGAQKKRSIGIKAIIKSINKFMTMYGSERGHPSAGVMAIEYPKNGKEPGHVKLDVNRDKDYQDWAMGKAESQIHSVFGWSKILTGLGETPGGIGSNIKLNELIINSPTIDEKRNWYSDFTTWLISEIYLKINDRPTEKGIVINDALTPIIEKLSAINGKTTRFDT